MKTPTIITLLAALALAAAPLPAQTYTFTTIAGATGLTGLSSIAVDSTGNLYITDSLNHTLRKITPAGVISILAGSAAQSGSADGTGSAARFSSPAGVAVDASGNVFVADSGNNAVRKVTPAGVTSTFAGLAGQFTDGLVDGLGAAARFSRPTGVAFDPAGNLYVSDIGNVAIRKITPTGLVTTLAGGTRFTGVGGAQPNADGLGSAAGFDTPTAVAVDRAGFSYVADRFANTIRKISPEGLVTTLAGQFKVSGSADGAGSAARFFSPSGVAVDRVGNVFVADRDNLTIRLITPTGVVSTIGGLAGNGGTADGTGSNARFALPIGIAVDQGGTIYVADAASGSIRIGVLTTPTTPSDARLFAISCRARVGSGGDILIPGIIIGGTGTRQIVVRAGGPAIQGVSGTLAKPQLQLYRVGTSTPIATNTGWSSGTVAERLALQAAFTTANLPEYPVGSADCALLATVEAGAAYTATVSGVDGTTGVALVEVYEIGAAGTARMTALSCRAQVGTGGDVLIPGLIILGTTPRQVIIRAKGPGIQDVAGVLAQPTLALYNGAGVKLAENTGWITAVNAAAIASATDAVGLAPLAAAAADCAILTTLAPGGYTALVSGVNNTSGVALIEIYEVP
jgi:NHL repeat